MSKSGKSTLKFSQIYVGIYQHYNISTNVIFFSNEAPKCKTTTNTRHKDDNVQVFVFVLVV